MAGRDAFEEALYEGMAPVGAAGFNPEKRCPLRTPARP